MKRYENVDIIAALGKLVEQRVEHFKEDFDIDKNILRQAAKSTDSADKTLLWMCRTNGTHCLRESEAFIRDTRDHNTFRFYDEQTREEVAARVVVPKALVGDKVMGDLFEINYREHVAKVAKESISPLCVKLTFEDGFVAEAPPRSYIEQARQHVSEHGKVEAIHTIPQDQVAHAALLSQLRNQRSRLPIAKEEKPSVRSRLKAEAARLPEQKAGAKQKGKEMEL